MCLYAFRLERPSWHYLSCVGWDVKPYTLTQSIQHCMSYLTVSVCCFIRVIDCDHFIFCVFLHCTITWFDETSHQTVRVRVRVNRTRLTAPDLTGRPVRCFIGPQLQPVISVVIETFDLIWLLPCRATWGCSGCIYRSD